MPVIRRCMTSDAPSSSPTTRYLPRLPTASIRRPASASSTRAGSSGRVQRSSSTSAASIVRPTTSGSSWRRTVSTSGSSGMRHIIAAITQGWRSPTRRPITCRRSSASTPTWSPTRRPRSTSRRRTSTRGRRHLDACDPERGRLLLVGGRRGGRGARVREERAVPRARRVRHHLRDLDLHGPAGARPADLEAPLQALLELLEASPLRVAVAAITEPNPASIALHEALGFERVGTLQGRRAEVRPALGRDLYERSL